ncbi:hypothetical protein G9403_02265 [Weissella paramesenteroides]|uniref:DUF1149 family protein n=1 Tax=Weissella paramesenteroides TaxID=1249 RepID=A0ABD4XH50_WEIPA|nr:hypothetical protein [Weissella paramesenteroides]MDF8368324.1 hypothetical protein [Weissella paramesenteroides]MDF8370487.1 hypothetical protein [Weissella paramesenteroides]
MMKKSFFKFSNPDIFSFTILQNPDFDKTKQDDTFKSLELEPEIYRDPDSNTANVKITLTNKEFFKTKNNLELNVHSVIDISAVASFKWKDGLDDGLVNELLEKNAVSLLVSYLRPYISSVTSAGENGAYYLPFIDLT